MAVVDPAEAGPVQACLEANGLSSLDFILNTHHHADHVGGNIELKDKYKCTIVGEWSMLYSAVARVFYTDHV